MSCFDKKEQYPQQPIRITELPEEEKAAEQKKQEELLREAVYGYFSSNKRRWEKQHKK